MRILYISTNTDFLFNKCSHSIDVYNPSSFLYKNGEVKQDEVKKCIFKGYDFALCDNVEIGEFIKKLNVDVIGSDLFIQSMQDNNYRAAMYRLAGLNEKFDGVKVHTYLLWNGNRIVGCLWICAVVGARIGSLLSENSFLWHEVMKLKSLLVKSRLKGLVKIEWDIVDRIALAGNIFSCLEGLEMFAELLDGDIIDLLNGLISQREFTFKNNVVVSIDLFRTQDTIPTFEPAANKHVWMYKNLPKTSSITDRVASVSSEDYIVRKAIRRATRTLERVKMEGKLWNKDIKGDLGNRLQLLKQCGVIV